MTLEREVLGIGGSSQRTLCQRVNGGLASEDNKCK